MKPAVKSPELEAVIKDVLGVDRIAAINENRCIPKPIGCGREVEPETWDLLTQKEFAISGLCANCQDTIFDTKSRRVCPPERDYYTPTDNDFVVERQPMICASAEAESRKYHKFVGKDGRIYLVADQPDAAANIYVAADPEELKPGYRGFQGFGGRTLTFKLVDDTELKLKGPWHTNSQDLFNNTGVDVRDKNYTFVVISRDRKSGKNYESIMVDVLYMDDGPQLGYFHRGDSLARQWAQHLGVPVYCFSQSSGGSSCGQVKPDAVFYREKDYKAANLSAAQDAIVRM